MLISGRRVGEALNIYAPDEQTVICSLFVKSVENKQTSDFNAEDNANELCAELVIKPDTLDPRRFGLRDATCRSFYVQAGDELSLYDDDLRTVIAEIKILEIKTNAKSGTNINNLIKSEYHAKIVFGSDFDNAKCLVFLSSKK